MSELPPPPEPYIAFSVNFYASDVVGWELVDGVWFLHHADRGVTAVPLTEPISIRPKLKP